jgi:FlaG/FlaF family flagellin (archaellin)
MTNILKRLLHDKRAISAVLSHLLLTVVAVALMSLAASATFVITTDLRHNMGERALVEDVWFTGESASVSSAWASIDAKGEGVVGVEIYLDNVGKVDMQVEAVYINHASQKFQDFSLKVGDQGTLNVDFTEWKPGEVYYIDIVTTRGNHIADSYKAT